MFKRCILKDADRTVNADRPDKYGHVGEAFKKVAEICNLFMTKEELASGKMTAQKVLKVMVAIKQVRDSYSPDNPDHLLDMVGYAELLDQLRQLGIE